MSHRPGSLMGRVRVCCFGTRDAVGPNVSICNNDYGVNIGQVTPSRLCRMCTNLRILSEISGVSRNKQNEGKISILGSQKSKRSQRFCIHINEIYINFIKIKFSRNSHQCLNRLLTN